MICTWINVWVNNLEAGDLRRNRAHDDVIVIICDDSAHARNTGSGLTQVGIPTNDTIPKTKKLYGL